MERSKHLRRRGQGGQGHQAGQGRCRPGGALIGSRFGALVVETSGGISKEYKRGAHPPTSRGGKGYEVVKRTSLVRVVPPPIELIDWDTVEGGTNGSAKGNGKHERNGHNGTGLFD